MAVIITNIDPNTLEVQNYSNQDINLIPTDITSSQFIPNKNYIEYTIISPNKVFQITENNFIDYKIINDYSPSNTDIVFSIDINPETDLTDRGFNNGEYNVIYNFLNNELSSSYEDRVFYIKEISSDRTEIKIASNVIDNLTLESLVNEFKNKLSTSLYFQDFYLNFGNNSLLISNNILIDNTKPQYEILINLYEALPSQFRIKDTLWVVTQVADPLAFNIQFQPEVIVPLISNPTIKGPNFDLSLKDRINNSTNYINYEELLNTGLITSYQQISSYLQDKSINISIDYSDFNDFIHFSSAKTRIENFYYKIQLIEQYNSDITNLSNTTSSSISESLTVLEDKVNNIITNFDGYEYWLYFESGSTTYPKGTSTPPYDLLYSGDATVITWYDNLIESASIFDQNNQDHLINTIPDYLRDDPQNDPYKIFVDMMGQFYDNIWIYYKDVANRYNGDNRLDYGISKDLVANALRSFGLKIYQNNFSTSDLYNAFTGINFLPSGSSLTANGNVYVTSSYITEGDYGYFVDDFDYTPGTTELITNYITASQEALFEPIDDINKEIYKRLYHNLPLLLKQKGTVAGLRNLINIYGIPDTILKISEFGGRDKDTSTYDYFDNQYNYKLDIEMGSYVETFWALDQKWPTSSFGGTDQGNIPVPETVQFRFKNIDLINEPSYSQSVWMLDNSPQGDIASLVLIYTGSAYSSASYSGSDIDPYYQYATLSFIPSSNYPNESASIYLPFYDNNWWSVMITWDNTNNFTLYAGNKLQYDGFDGNQVGFLSSSSVTSSGHPWNDEETTYSYFGKRNDIYLPNEYEYFTGSFQEIRYYTYPLGIDSFKNFIMNPNSIDITGENIYADYLSFRGSLGGELYTGSVSIHPKITGSWATTQSFFVNSGSSFLYQGSSLFSTNIETRFLNSPIAGLRNRVTDKIQIVSQSLPPLNLEFTQSGDILSQYISIEQNYLVSGSETPDVNALEVAFSPTNEIDDDIIASLGYFNIGDYIGDPRQISSSATSYPDLDVLANNYFEKYYDNYNLIDYIRLIKFFDNSLFKMIKDFVPARTNLRSGIVVKQHILERNKYPQPQTSWEDVTYSGSIDTAFFSGSTGGTFNEFNKLGIYSFTTNTNNYILTTSSFTNVTPNLILSGEEVGFLIIPSASTFTTFFEGLFEVRTNGDFTTTGNAKLYISSSNGLRFIGSDNVTPFKITSSLVEANYGETFELIASSSSPIFPVSNSFFEIVTYPISLQTWGETTIGPSGSTILVQNDQKEFYNGELPGTVIEVTNGELTENNEFRYPSTLEINYDIVFYKSNITPLGDFLNNNTSPDSGEIYLWYDTGSNTQISLPGGIGIGG